MPWARIQRTPWPSRVGRTRHSTSKGRRSAVAAAHSAASAGRSSSSITARQPSRAICSAGTPKNASASSDSSSGSPSWSQITVLPGWASMSRRTRRPSERPSAAWAGSAPPRTRQPIASRTRSADAISSSEPAMSSDAPSSTAARAASWTSSAAAPSAAIAARRTTASSSASSTASRAGPSSQPSRVKRPRATRASRAASSDSSSAASVAGARMHVVTNSRAISTRSPAILSPSRRPSSCVDHSRSP